MHSGQLTLNNLSEGELGIVFGTLQDHRDTLHFDAQALRSHDPALSGKSAPVASSSLPHVRLHPPFGWPPEQDWPPAPAQMPASAPAHEDAAAPLYDSAVFTWANDAGFSAVIDLLQRLGSDLGDVPGRSQQHGEGVVSSASVLPIYRPAVRRSRAMEKREDQSSPPTETEAQRLWQEQEKDLDDALKETFPASDPIAPGRFT